MNHYPSTYEEERQEAFAGVMESLARDSADGDERAACFRLLEHLTAPAIRRPNAWVS